jgi:stage II sporulation protein AB (anti-sigma F factor)
MEFDSRPENEFVARSAIAAFTAQLDPTIDELSEIKTAVSEAVSNCVIHAYQEGEGGRIWLEGWLYADKSLKITISDEGVGIEDVGKAREPLFTTKPEDERSGMGFTVMESFVDQADIVSSPGHGTQVTLIKAFDKKYID